MPHTLSSVRVTGAEIEFFERPFLKPLQLSTGLIAACTEARAKVTVEAGDRRAEGRGSIYLSDLWAWPDPAISHAERDAVLRQFCEKTASDLPEICAGPAHPAELGLRLHEAVAHGDHASPVLARAMCASPFDAAIHDAAGLAFGLSAFALFDEDCALPAADPLFAGSGDACRAIREMLLPEPRTEFDAWWIVGAGDDLETAVAPAVLARGIRCFKLKIHGKDAGVDAARTAEIYCAAKRWGITKPRLSVDTNEGNPDADSVRDYLISLRELDPGAFDALEYLEQPTGRDLAKSAFDWTRVNALKPVLLDEGLTGFDQLGLAREQGWAGLALKTCKGHSFALVAAAWAHRRGMPLALQDLTNPGYSAIHAALFASRVPTLNGVELNSPQYTPAANAEWLPRLACLFEPKNGLHRLPSGEILGLGSRL